ncbi:hypothetical protein [Pseudoduganella lutea]|uniref:DUF4148 domain-containing protein n=1 Tax=Pseudoduganella lutea TaxID=321985 RepID=A0A4P6L537_9BURK|nr:hypothetical protein [Pseudoduganella lutea]QBE66786.1 hypothetical protein EWM63_30620 [Pseudoduganella lutea]
MNIQRHRHWALAAALCALSAHAAEPKSTPAETPAAQQERAARAEFLDKQKQLFEEKRITVDAPARDSTPVLDLPQEESDTPGAVKR